jgi:hypothetical protein
MASSADVLVAAAPEVQTLEALLAARPLVEPVRPPEAVALSALPAVAAEALVLQRPSVRQRAVFLRSSVLLLPR